MVQRGETDILSATVAGHVGAIVVAAVAHLLLVLGDPVLGDDLAVVGHQEATVLQEDAGRAGELLGQGASVSDGRLESGAITDHLQLEVLDG